MSKKLLVPLYIIIGIFIIVCDQLSKWFALSILQTGPLTIAPWLTFRLVFNRGISWGMFSSSHQLTFLTVTAVVIAVTGMVAFMVYKDLLREQTAIGGLFILSGSISNLIDRFIHCSVIDFVEVSYKNWIWPVFNLADCFIIIGVIFIFINQYKSS